MHKKYYISKTAYGSCRLYVKYEDVGPFLEMWLDIYCCWGGFDKSTEEVRSWEFNISYYEDGSLSLMLESEGFVFDDFPSNAKWIK